MDKCIFCKIVAGEMPCNKIYEDDKVFAFLDHTPINPGHTLVIPKEHYEQLDDVPDDLLCDVIKVVKKVGGALKKELGVKGYNLGQNNGSVAGQTVFHSHFHVIPRSKGDGLTHWGQKKYKKGEAEEIVKKLQNNLK